MYEFIAGAVVGGLAVAAISYMGTLVIEKYFGGGE